MNDDLITLAKKALEELWGSGGPALLSLDHLPPQASTRRYFRLNLSAPAFEEPSPSLLLVTMPRHAASDEASVGEQPVEVHPFSSMQAHLKSVGVRVPEIYLDKWQEGYQIISDLGPWTLKNIIEEQPEKKMEMMERALDLLIDFQTRFYPCPGPAALRTFEKASIRCELEHFTQWALMDFMKVRPSSSESTLLDESFSSLTNQLCQTEYRPQHRDFQSSNIVSGPSGLGIIDFQDAFMATPVYDLVALLRDSYVVLDEVELLSLLNRYMAHTRVQTMPHEDFKRLFWLQTVQRKLKDAGRFVFIHRVKNNPSFLPYISPSMDCVFHALDRLGNFHELAGFLQGCYGDCKEKMSQSLTFTGL